MQVPVDASFARKGGVGGRRKMGREERGEMVLGEVVEEIGKKDLVDVVGEGGQGEAGGEGTCEGGEEGGRREGVVHLVCFLFFCPLAFFRFFCGGRGGKRGVGWEQGEWWERREVDVDERQGSAESFFLIGSASCSTRPLEISSFGGHTFRDPPSHDIKSS